MNLRARYLNKTFTGVPFSLLNTTILAGGFDPYKAGVYSPDLVFDFENEFYRTNNRKTTFTNAITHTRASNATMVDSDGLIKWAPHNLALNSASPATQDITVVSGADYTVEITGSGSVTLSGAGTGTVSEGSPVEVTASTTTLTLTVSGSVDTMWCYRSDLGGMVKNPDTGTTYVPTTSSAVYLPRRGHHVYENGQWVNKGLLLETEARTNLRTYSNGFDNDAWLKSGSTVSAAEAVSPDGTTNAYKMTESAANETHRVRGASGTEASVSGNVCLSIFAKAAERDIILVREDQETGYFAYFNLSSGTVTKGVGATEPIEAFIEYYGSGWYRCSVISAQTSSADLDIRISATGSDSGLYAGDGTSGIYIWGAQLEEASTPSSYIPTSGSTVTRAAESLTVPAAKLPYSSTAMSIAMEGTVTYADTGLGSELRFADWDGSLYANLRTSGGNTGAVQFIQIEDGNVYTVSGFSSQYLPGINVPYNIASRHGSTFVNGAVDGTALTADTTPTALPDLETTDLSLAFDYMGTIARFRMWDVDLGDDNLEVATS